MQFYWYVFIGLNLFISYFSLDCCRLLKNSEFSGFSIICNQMFDCGLSWQSIWPWANGRVCFKVELKGLKDSIILTQGQYWRVFSFLKTMLQSFISIINFSYSSGINTNQNKNKVLWNHYLQKAGITLEVSKKLSDNKFDKVD